MKVIKVDNTNEKEIIQNSDSLVVIDFYAEWCPPCKLMGPVIEKVANEVENVVIAKIDIDKSKEIAEKYQIMSIPTLVFVKNNKVVERSTGFKMKKAILKLIEKNQ